MSKTTVSIDRIDSIVNVFGPYDNNLKILREELDVDIADRDSELVISGSETNVTIATETIKGLLALATKGEQIEPQNVKYVLDLVINGKQLDIEKMSGDVICISAKGIQIRPKTLGQIEYVSAIENNTITLAIGPAGTGKTYLAVAKAVAAFRSKQVNKIILTRPAVEAGERLGFLPGDLQSKVDPYLRPLYDGLSAFLGVEAFNTYQERGNIEVAPLAYMRGRTLDDSFIILDEAQNTSKEQMKMFLTRLGFGSKIVITGDITQIDLPSDKTSGLRDAMNILAGVGDIKICNLSSDDVVRHQLVTEIVRAYEKKERPQGASKAGGRSVAGSRSKATRRKPSNKAKST